MGMEVFEGELTGKVLPGRDPRTIVLRRGPKGEAIAEGVAHRFVVHSPTGFEWGYGGSGPGDLALNILAEFLAPPDAWVLHQAFKWAFIAHVPREGGTLPAQAIGAWVAQHFMSAGYQLKREERRA
jgi:hypothetical protein